MTIGNPHLFTILPHVAFYHPHPVVVFLFSDEHLHRHFFLPRVAFPLCRPALVFLSSPNTSISLLRSSQSIPQNASSNNAHILLSAHGAPRISLVRLGARNGFPFPLPDPSNTELRNYLDLFEVTVVNDPNNYPPTVLASIPFPPCSFQARNSSTRDRTVCNSFQ